VDTSWAWKLNASFEENEDANEGDISAPKIYDLPPPQDPVNFEYTVKRFFNTYTLQKCPLSLIYLRFWSPCSSWQHPFNHPHVTPLTQAHPHHNRRPLEFGYEYISREFVALFTALLANWLWHGWLSFQTGGLGWLWLWARWLGVPVLRFHFIRMTKLNRYDCQNVSTPVALLFHCGRVSGRDSEVGVVKTFHCFDWHQTLGLNAFYANFDYDVAASILITVTTSLDKMGNRKTGQGFKGVEGSMKELELPNIISRAIS